MRDFNRKSRGGNGGFGNRGNRNGFSDRRRDGDKPQLFDAICDNCGRECRVPFRPSGNKQIFCSECFEKLGNGREDRGFIEKSSYGRKEYSNAPFKEKKDYNTKTYSSEIAQFKSQLASINEKLDLLLELVTPRAPEKKEEVLPTDSL